MLIELKLNIISVFFSFAFFRHFLSSQNSPARQEELLAMAVEYLRTRQQNNRGPGGGGLPSMDHTATATPHNKRSRRRHQHQPHSNGTVFLYLFF